MQQYKKHNIPANVGYEVCVCVCCVGVLCGCACELDGEVESWELFFAK